MDSAPNPDYVQTASAMYCHVCPLMFIARPTNQSRPLHPSSYGYQS